MSGETEPAEGSVQGSEQRLTREQRAYLVRVAHEQVTAAALGQDERSIDIPDDPVYHSLSGAFVTLYDGEGGLRGCIGYVLAQKPLAATVAAAAYAAASRDPRFSPVSPSELQDIWVDISVLSPLWVVDDVEDIEVGRHGLVVQYGPYQGLLLPQVAARYGWSREKFLEETCRKAGLSTRQWHEAGVTIKAFTAEVFSEKEIQG